MVSYVRIKSLIDESQLVRRTQILRSELDRMYSDLLEVESSQRGYILTAIVTSIQNLNTRIDTIASLTRGNLSQQKNLSDLRLTVFARVNYLQKVLADAQNSVIEVPRLLVGKALMDDVARQVEKIGKQEEEQLQAQLAKLDRSISITPLLSIILIIGSILIVVGAYFKLLKELKISGTLKKDIHQEKELRRKIEESELLYRQIFDFSPVAIWEKDDETLLFEIQSLRSKGVINFREYLDSNPKEIERLLAFIWLTRVNDESIQLLEAESKEEVLAGFQGLFTIESVPLLKEAIVAIAEGKKRLIFNAVINSFKGRRLEILFAFDFRIGNALNKSLVTLTDLTIEKGRERDLKETKDRLRLATEASGVGIWEWNVITGQIHWDEQMFHIYGVNPTSDGFIDYATWSNAVAPEDLLEQERVLQKALTDLRTSNRTFKIYRANDGTSRCIEAVDTVRENSRGEMEWMVGTNKDITESKFVEEQLEKLATHIDLATKSAGVGTWLLHIITGKLEWSDLHKRMWGYDENLTDLCYEDWYKPIHPDDREKCFAEIAAAMTEKRKYEVDYRILNMNDSTVQWIKSLGEYQYNEKGEAQTLTGISVNVTGNKIVEERLMASEENFRQLSDLMPEKVSRSDSNGNVIYYNQSWLDYTGMDYEELMNWGWSRAMHEDDIEELTRLWIHSVTTGDDFEMEFRIMHKDGLYRWHLCRSAAIKGDAGEIINWVGVTIDIEQQKRFSGELELMVKNRTAELLQSNEDLKRSEELLLQRNKEQEKLNKELEAFNYISSHDLQEPLRQIQNFASRIIDTEQMNLTDKGKDYVERMNNAAKRMQTLIGDLLAYSSTKMAKGKFELIDLNEIVSEVIVELADSINEKHASIELHGLCELTVIRFQFRQMIHNLIGNTLKFSKPGTPLHIIIKSKIVHSGELTITGLLPETEYCHVSIADNGIGFEPQYKDRIFEVFQRLHDKQKIAGTGIGLTIVKKIVDNHNGIITATGKPNVGATFDIYIPVNQKIN